MKYWPAYDFEKTVWEISWANLSMLLATIPSFEDDKDNAGQDDTQEINTLEEFEQFLNRNG